jgi:hypothetical protein
MATFLDQQQEKFLEVLEQNMGVVSLTLDMTKTSRAVFNDWMTEVFFNEKVKDIDLKTLDIVEKLLLEEINKGNMGAIQFYLKTKGRNRGYV